jgi:hypothetical protein
MLTENPEKALETLDTIKNKSIKCYIRDVTTPIDRAKQIAENIFIRKNPFKSIGQLVEFRNKVVREWVDAKEGKGYSEAYSWNLIAKKYNIPMTMPIFNQWVLDVNDYLTIDIKKFK